MGFWMSGVLSALFLGMERNELCGTDYFSEQKGAERFIPETITHAYRITRSFSGVPWAIQMDVHLKVYVNVRLDVQMDVRLDVHVDVQMGIEWDVQMNLQICRPAY